MQINAFSAFQLFIVTRDGHIGWAMTFKILNLKVAHMLNIIMQFEENLPINNEMKNIVIFRYF